jgi:polyisoprenoid-binding protein YceI
MSQTAQAVSRSEFPAPGVYDIDPAHSTLGAVARHLMFTKVRGSFGEFSGALNVDADPTRSTVEATISAASVDTGQPQRDEHLRSPDFLDVEKYPEISFKSSRIEDLGEGRLRVTGDFTIHGVTNELVLDGVYEGDGTDPWGGQRVMFSATGSFDREAYGMTWNQALETGGVLVSKKFDLELEIAAVLRK